jgi:AcrR family transcriptional regulator
MTDYASIASATVRERIDTALAEYLGSLTGHDLGEITVEAVAQEAGVSRATAYRYLGSRDELLYRSAIVLAQGHMGRCLEILEQTPTMAARMEEAFAYTVRETAQDVLLQLLLRSARADAIDEALRVMTGDLFRDSVEGGQADGQVRSDVTAEELIAWQVEQLYVVFRLRLDEEAARLWVRRFLVPAVRPPGGSDAGLRPQVRAVLDDVHRRLREVDRSVTAAWDAMDD